MFQCKNCRNPMVKTNHEYYCPKCGLVENNYLNHNNYREGVGMPVPHWQANMQQTQNPFIRVGGRIFIKNK